MIAKDYKEDVYYKLYNEHNELLFVTQVRNNVKLFIEELTGDNIEIAKNNYLILGNYRMTSIHVETLNETDQDFEDLLPSNAFSFAFTDYTKDKDCIGYYFDKPELLDKKW